MYHSRIAELKFSIVGSDDIKYYAQGKVTSEELFIGQTPVSGGLYSLEMGATTTSPCMTCEKKMGECIGHFDLLDLNYPIISPLFIRQIGQWLKSVCFKCGASLLDLKDYTYIPAGKRLKEVAAMLSNKQVTCKNPHCLTVQPKIEKNPDDYISFNMITKDGSIRRLYPHDMMDIFGRITQETIKGMGQTSENGPNKLILTKLLIPPVTIRPSVKSAVMLAEGTDYAGIITFLQYIVKKNKSMPTKIPSSISLEDSKKILNLQQLYFDFIVGSSITGNKRGLIVGNKQAQSIMKRQIKKVGRIRGNLLGKRVWFISRTTIAGNPAIRIDQVIMPYAYAKVLQREESVIEINKSKMKLLLSTDVKHYPRATRVKKQNGGVYDATRFRDGNIEDGDRIYRDVTDEDIILMNRQPSLEKTAIGGHKPIISKDLTLKTFQFNVCACKWYGADFDGDAMVGIVPRSLMAYIEAKILSRVQNNFISAKTSGPINGQVQDSTLGCFELTKSDVRINRYHAMSMYSLLGNDAPILNWNQEIFTGRDIISGLLKKYPVSLIAKPTYYDENFAGVIPYDPKDIKVMITNGVHESGVLDKKTIGEGAVGGIYHLISREYGSKVALDKVYDSQQAALRFLANVGFSISLADLVLPADKRQAIADEASGLLREAQIINDQLIAGEILPPIGMTVHEFYEKLQINALKKSDVVMRSVLGGLNTKYNGMYKMPAVGSKGNWPNLEHITAFVGQIDINTERIGETFSFRRTSPYHTRFSMDPRAYGFISNSYVSGMRSDEFIPSDMNGRYDLINKALSTSITGYQMRKSIDALQSAQVDFFRRVCIHHKIVEYLYGEDGLDPQSVENVKFPTVMLNDKELEEKYLNQAFPEEFKLIKQDRDMYRAAFLGIESINFNSPMNDVHILPVNIERIVVSAIRKNADNKSSENDVSEMVKRVITFAESIPYVLINEIQEKQRSKIPLHISAASSLLQMSIRCELNSKTVLPRLTMNKLDEIFLRIRADYSKALVDYGSGVGFWASQAICEPLTQYMLDSHHRSISGGTNKSGIIRVKEILGARPVEEEQSPEMLIRPLPEYEQDMIKVREIANGIELLTFGRFIKNNPIKLFEQYGQLVYPGLKTDAKWIQEFETFHPLIKAPGDLANWCIWVELDKAMLLLKGMQLEMIVTKLRTKHPDVFIIHNRETDPRIRLRLYVRVGYFGKNVATEDKLDTLITNLLDTPIRGVLGIQNVNVVPITRQLVSPTTGGIIKQNVYAIKTVGTNIYGVALNKYIDPYSIVSTSIGDTYKMFGIEAARQKIISELGATVESSKPSIRHIQIYADVMTCTSKVKSVEQSGLVAREKNNPLLLSALADPQKHLKEAAIHGKTNTIYGAAAALMVGDIPKYGTYYCNVSVNEEFVKKNTKTIESVIEELL